LKNSNNFFEIFSLPVGWEVDIDQLNLRFRRLQREFHPDRYASKSDIEKRLAVQTAATINQAYETLKTPLARAQYLLELQGCDSSQESHITSDGQFLMDQMLLREALSEVRASAEPLDVLVSLSIEAQQKSMDLQRQFAQQYQASAYNDAFDTVAKMQFATKFVNDIAQLEAELEDF